VTDVRRWTRRIPLVLFVLAVAAGIVYAFLPRAVEVDVAPVTRGLLQVGIVDDGKTRVEEPYTVSAPLAGRVLRIELEPGDLVVEDQTVLATIEPTDPELLNERELAEAQARVNAAESAVRRAATALERIRDELRAAESDYARVRELAGRDAATPRQLEQAELGFQTKTEDYRAAVFSHEIAEYELDLARAALRRTIPEADAPADTSSARLDPWQFPIRSPITGKVLRVFQESMTVVAPGTRLIEVGDPRQLELEIDLLSTDAVRVNPGDRVIVEHWGGDFPLAARVKRVEPSAFTKISALGVEEQRVNVIAELVTPPEQREMLGDAFRIEARIVVWEGPDVLKVPTSALFRRGDEWAVFVVAEGEARLRTVEIGHTSGLEAEVLEGLESGERVILHPSDRIEDGVAVEPQQPD
jgi:HlyD family secretion protein